MLFLQLKNCIFLFFPIFLFSQIIFEIRSKNVKFHKNTTHLQQMGKTIQLYTYILGFTGGDIL